MASPMNSEQKSSAFHTNNVACNEYGIKDEIHAEMGYGSRSVGSIPANSTLIFEVELLNVY